MFKGTTFKFLLALNALFLLSFTSLSHAEIPGMNLNTQALNIQVDPSSGSANVPIQIAVPPGRAGIEPNIAIGYNSSSRNLGLAGVGWSFDLGSIYVTSKKAFLNMTARMTICLAMG